MHWAMRKEHCQLCLSSRRFWGRKESGKGEKWSHCIIIFLNGILLYCRTQKDEQYCCNMGNNRAGIIWRLSEPRLRPLFCSICVLLSLTRSSETPVLPFLPLPVLLSIIPQSLPGCYHLRHSLDPSPLYLIPFFLPVIRGLLCKLLFSC